MIQTTPPLQQLVSFSHQLADQSGSAILPYYRTTLNVDDKGAGHRFDPVTEGDRAAETIIRNAITEHFPSHAVLGEEHGESLSDSRYRWVIDPIDGTRAFILGVPTWGTLIGLEIDGKPAIGMMNQPHTGDRFWSDGSASFLRAGALAPRQLKTRTSVTALRDAQLASTHPDLFSPGHEKEAFQNICKSVKATRFGTDCVAYALLAAGLIDLVVEAGLQPYDIVALIPIIETAGGVITTWDGAAARNGGRIVAAANPSLHEQALHILKTTI